MEKQNTQELVLPINYDSFNEFYGENKLKIYQELIKGYEYVSENLNETFQLKINANVENINFSTTFNISKNDDEIIERLNYVYLPYFQKIEDYETCDKIKNIYKKIKGII